MTTDNNMIIPEVEPDRQFFYINLAKDLITEESQKLGRPMNFHVKTFGCQMNSRDSEKLSGILKQIGFIEAESEEADFVLYNTCTVRENANNKVYGKLGYLQTVKKKHPWMKIALCGCMMQEEEVVQKLQKSYRYVDLIFGTHNIYKLAELIFQMYHSSKMVVDIWKETDEIVENLPVDRKYSFKSGVNIMFGCNNFCSYCIVPYVRGRERSRDAKSILCEIQKLIADGVIEIMLLGQNVNSYGKDIKDGIYFAQLLEEIDQLNGIKRIRFMTSHPKDLSDDIIEVMAHSNKICHQLHLPLQSGSSRLLTDMNRHYTKEDYLSLVKRIKDKIPDIALSTDLIVGYPGETEEDFMETMDVVSKVGYSSAFTFIYSKRSGTPAAKNPNQVPEDVIKHRFERLLQLVQNMGKEEALRFEGTVAKVLVEQVNEQDSSLLTGRLENNLVCHFKGDSSMIGQIVEVKLIKCKNFYYIGELEYA